MAITLLGNKVGMTRIFTESGESVPVTVIEMAANRVSQKKTVETDGYNAVQLTAGEKKSSKVSKSMAGHFAKASVKSGLKTMESRIDNPEAYEVGSEIGVDTFTVGQKVDVSGTSIGKGFQGGIKRHNFTRQDMTHGNSISHRSNGSIGQNQTPGRVFKGKKMSGQMGNVKKTIQSITVVKVDTENNLLLVKGGVPGPKGSYVSVSHAVKSKEA